MLPQVAEGTKIKHWTVIKRAANYKRDRAYLCRCDCGTEKVLTAYKLKQPNAFVSCRKCSVKLQKHGDTVGHNKSPLYTAWDNMKRRCRNVTHPMYKHYGGRGIDVCEEWANSFEVFKKWALENGWEKGLSIDRIDNNRGYSPDNCRWTTQKVQCNNTRRNTFATISGITKPCTYWLKKYGVSYWFVRTRMKKYNVTFAEAINMPRERKKGIYA